MIRNRIFAATVAAAAVAVAASIAQADRPDRPPGTIVAADGTGGSVVVSCGSNLAAALPLDAAQTAMLNQAFPKGVSCEGTGPTYFGCFRGDTIVETEAGRRPIRDVRVGDRVWSWDDAQKKRILSRVSQTFAYPARQLRTLVAGGETFRVTDRHPFWVDGKGWVEAARLVAGDKLRTGGNELVSVRSNERADAIAFYQGYDASMDRSAALRHPIFQLQRVSTGASPSETGIVYNIEVDGVHNYYVGASGILVHNK